MANKMNCYSGVASVAAGLIWLLIGLHQRATHGPTTFNEMRLLFGFTWMDSGKLLVLPLILLVLPMTNFIRYEHLLSGRIARLGGRITRASLFVLIVSVVVEYWTFPWGSYLLTFDAEWPRIGGIVQAVTSMVFTLGVFVYSIGLAKANVIKAWMVPVLTTGALTTFYLTPVSFVPAVAWLIFGTVLIFSKDAPSGVVFVAPGAID